MFSSSALFWVCDTTLQILSQTINEQIIALLDLYQKLGVAELQSGNPDGRVNHSEMMNRLRKRLNE